MKEILFLMIPVFCGVLMCFSISHLIETFRKIGQSEGRLEGHAKTFESMKANIDLAFRQRDDCLLVLSKVIADIRGRAHEDLTHLDSFKDAQKLLDGCIIIRGERLN